MLKINIIGGEMFDEATEKFITIKPTTITLEHSLIAISKWESKYHKPFLEEEEKTPEEIRYYIECMTITPNVDPNIYKTMPSWQVEEIMDYIKDPMTATWFGDDGKKSGRGVKKEVVTSELIYYWMISLQIPAEYEKWHINRLLTLIQVCNVKNAPNDTKKMSKNEIARNYDAINAARRAKLHTKG